MPKRITSPVKQYPGDVILCDPLTLLQVWAIEDALTPELRERLAGDRPERAFYDALPVFLACVEKWEIDGIPANPGPADFPATPPSKRQAGMALVAWLINSVMELFDEAETIPNA